MLLDDLVVYFNTSPAIKLLRSPNAAFVLDFLHQQFKTRPDRISQPASELTSALNEYRERIRELYPTNLPEKSEQYLTAWCANETRWLHRTRPADRDEPCFQLTADTEDVFIFLDRALQKGAGFVGTESRLRLIIDTLATLVAGASRDPDVRLHHLRGERQRIDEEIQRVMEDGMAARFEPTATRELFGTAVSLLRQLLADFREVEDRFSEITLQVQRRQVVGSDKKGSILEYALDAEDLLKQEDQGVSFYEFVRFILSPVQQERLVSIINELGRIDEIAEQAEGLQTVRRMVPSLLAEAEKVMRTNQRLSAALRRLLDWRSASERQRVAQLLQEIKRAAAALAENLPGDDIGATVEIGVVINLAFSRTFWTRPAEFECQDLVEHVTDTNRKKELFSILAQLHRLDWKTMRARVKTISERTDNPTLKHLIEEYPPTGGIIEVLGYVQIAKDEGHIVSHQSNEEIALLPDKQGDMPRRLTVPVILFLAPVKEVHGDSAKPA